MAGWQYPQRLTLAHVPTPLLPLDRLSAQLGGRHRIWIKRDDMTGSVLSGNKVRKLEFTLADALAQGANALVTCGGLQSNHCRATAILGAQLGLRVHLVLRGTEAECARLDGNLLLDRLCGASQERHAPADYIAHFDGLITSAMTRLQRDGFRPYFITTGASDAVGVWGYVHACQELAGDLAKQGITQPVIVCASGSGGTQAGLMAGNVLHGLNALVCSFNVCDDAAWFQKKIRDDLMAWNARYGLQCPVGDWPVHVIDGYVGAGYARVSNELLALIADVAQLEGVILDPVYTGKAFYGLLSEISRGRFDEYRDIVFLHTGGVFGVYPYAGAFTDLLEIV
jgi:D-cysteine desulfhydrase